MNRIKHLYIIGNGFDIHHGRKTSYEDFYDWSIENNNSTIQEIEEIIGIIDADWWSNFENSLADVDAYSISQEIAFENTPDLLDDHVDRQWNDAEVYTEQLFSEVYEKIHELFEDWIKNGIKDTNPHKLVTLSIVDSFFLSFNYTLTLEESYRIPSNQILHIHGSVNDGVFIIGHGKTREEIASMYDHTEEINHTPPMDDEEGELYDDSQDEGLQLHEQLALDAAISGVAGQEKPIKSIIAKHRNFFESLSEVTDIHIFGFSFSDIDLPYLENIVPVIDKNKVIWEVSDFQDQNKQKIKVFFEKHNISNYKIISLDDILSSGNQL